VRTPLLLLLGAAGLVLLVACTNLASTLLARGATRARELAVRTSLGARRGRIMTQLLVESLLLSTLGAAAGMGLAALVVRGIRVAAPSFLPRIDEVGIDGSVLLFTAAVAVLTALLFGLLPALRLSRAGTGQALRSGSRGNAEIGRGGIWRFLVGTEVALALVLLAGSALLVRSFRTVLSEDPGFDPSDVDVMPVSLSQIAYPTGEAHTQFYERFLSELEALPGVSSAGVISVVPVEGAPPNGRLELDGNLEKHADGWYVIASDGAFRALDIPLLEGRLFDTRDGPGDPHVAVVSRAFAERYWQGESAVGKSVTGGGMDEFYEDRTFARVVGVVDDVRHAGLTRETYPTVYFPFTQRPMRLRYAATVVVEAASGDAAALIAALRDRLRAADPDVPVRIRTMEGVVRASVGERRFLMMVLGGFSFTALILAGVGIFGVVSYSVARRTREMGIRMALGADPGGVLRLVMLAAMRMVALGLVVGVIGAVAFTRVMRSLLYEVSPTDPLALAGSTLLLAGAALMASWLPARAGTRVDPMITMRAE
jgi:predicted permease